MALHEVMMDDHVGIDDGWAREQIVGARSWWQRDEVDQFNAWGDAGHSVASPTLYRAGALGEEFVRESAGALARCAIR